MHSKQAKRYLAAADVIRRRYPKMADWEVTKRALEIAPLMFEPEILDPNTFTLHRRPT